MNNQQIILNERIRLMDEGIIKSTGKLMKYQLPSGEEIQIPEPEEIHTLKKWRTLKGCIKVKEGEKPVSQIPIWKPYCSNKGRGLIFKAADFYTISQLEEYEV